MSNALKVGDLIDELSKYPRNQKLRVALNNGRTLSGIGHIRVIFGRVSLFLTDQPDKQLRPTHRREPAAKPRSTYGIGDEGP